MKFSISAIHECVMCIYIDFRLTFPRLCKPLPTSFLLAFFRWHWLWLWLWQASTLLVPIIVLLLIINHPSNLSAAHYMTTSFTDLLLPTTTGNKPMNQLPNSWGMNSQHVDTSNQHKMSNEIPKYKSFPPASLPISSPPPLSPSSYLSIPPTLSPSVLLDSPLLFSSSNVS